MSEAALNNDLLRATQPKDGRSKRNSKDELIKKIVQLAEQNEIKLEHSDTKLKRMNKHELNGLLADTAEKVMRNEMARQVGATPGASDSVIALGALRMMHDIAARCAETGANVVLPTYGYKVEGFVECLQDPSVREATDACLVEIAKDSEILQYVKSPWARLMIAWGGALVSSVRKIPPARVNGRRYRYSAEMERRGHGRSDPGSQLGAGWREEAGKEHGDCTPIVEVCEEV